MTQKIVWEGRKTGVSWFHPRACLVVEQDGRARCLMTCQTIQGSDVFGPVHWSVSDDGAATWSDPEPIPGMGRVRLPDGWEEGVCDVVPEYHGPTGTILCIGHNVYYEDNRLARPQRLRYPIFAIRKADGTWIPRKKLEWDHERACGEIYTCGCGQRVVLDNGDILIPFSFSQPQRDDRAVCTVRCRYDGNALDICSTGNALALPVRRGLLEPSLACFEGRYYLTVRAEDERGYGAVSEDGLDWHEMRPWSWDDGTPLAMSTTQQHWLIRGGHLFLVYTRKSDINTHVFRWRAPLYMARVDPDRLRLVKETETVVFPLLGDGIAQPDHVALMGNFSTAALAPDTSLVLVGENMIRTRACGNTLQATIC